MANTGARGFYLLTDFIKNELLEDSDVNTVTYGAIEDIDLEKQTIYPLSHVNVPDGVIGEQFIQYTVTIISMDVVDESKAEVTDIYVGNDNEQDVLNTQAKVLAKLVSKIRRNRLVDGFELVGDPTIEAFTDRFGNKVAGWALTMSINVANDIYLC